MASFTRTQIVPGTTLTGAAINTAIGNLPGDGGVVIVEEGTYVIDGSDDTIDVPSDVTIIGRGDVVLSVTANVPLFKNEDFGTASKSRIVISGFKIHVNMASGKYYNNLIHIKGVTNSVLEKLTISAESGDVGSTYSAIKLEGIQYSTNYYECSGNVISECNIQNFGYGIQLQGADSGHCNCEENMIQNNTISDCITANIQLSYAQRNIISGNALSNATNYGLWIIYVSNFNVVTGNEVIDNGSRGIYILYSYGCTIQSNVCKSNGGSGIRLLGTSTKKVSYCAIIGNACCNNSADGIRIENYSDHNVFNGNTCTGNTNAGINEYNNTSIDYNLFVGNIACNNGTDSLIVNGDHSNVANNIVD